MYQIADAVHVDDAATFLQRFDAAGQLGDHAILMRGMLQAMRLAR